MSNEVVVADTVYYQNLDTVARLHMQGKNPTVIARETNIPRKDVVRLVDDWKTTLAAQHASSDRALDALNQMDEHYSHLIKESYESLQQIEDDLNQSGFTAAKIQQKLAAIKTIADLESKRLDALQRAGILDAQDMGDQMAKIEEHQAILIDILKNDLCSVCKPEVMRRLGKITGRAEVIVTQE